MLFETKKNNYSVIRICLVVVCLASTVATSSTAVVKKPIKKNAKPVFSVSNDVASKQKPKPKPSANIVKKDTVVDTVALAPDTATVPSRDTVRHHDSLSAANAQNAMVKNTPAQTETVHTVVAKDTSKLQIKAPDSIAKPIVIQNQSFQKPASKNRSQKSGWKLWLMLGTLFSLGCIALALIFLKKQKGTGRFLTTTRLSVMDKEVQMACRFIEKNYANPGLDTETICKELVTGEAFLESLIQRDLGVSVSEFISHVRINNAKRLLELNGTTTAESMSQQIGFAKTADFEAAFHRITGTRFDSFQTQVAKDPVQ